MVELTIRHPDGSTETIPETTSWTRTRELGSMRRARIDVERSLAEAVTLNQKSDLVDLGTIDTLRLVGVETGGSTWTLVCYSLEWDANREPFTAGGVERTGTDADLINTSISNVASWSAGTINSFTGSLAFVFSHAHEHDAIRRVERNTQGEILFRDEGTVDYVDRIGTDKSGSVELSASAGTIEDTIQITKRGRELDGTHIRVLGAHEGEAQLFANLVPQDDPQTYENEVRYSTPRWSDSDDTDWDRWENKDVSDQATIEEEAAALGDELTESLVEAEATVSGVDVSLGDTVQVVKPDADLNRSMRIHRLKEVAEGATRRLKALLSTRTTLRQADDRQLEDIRKFNAGFQGSSVSITGGPLEKAVDASNSMTLNFRYPDIEFENAAELHVRGLPYRIDSVGAASGGGFHSHTVTLRDHDHLVDVPDHDHEFDINIPDHRHDVTIPVPTHTHVLSNPGATGASGRTFDTFESSPTLENHSHVFEVTGDIFDFDAEVETSDDGGSYFESTTTDDGGGIFQSTEGGGGTTETTSDETPHHTHPPEPGIYQTSDTPSNVDVLINGDTVATNIGSGTFETVIDISGEMTPGAWNDITLESDSLGVLSASAYVRGYDQIGKQ